MHKTASAFTQAARRGLLLIAVCGVMTACNLGAQASPEAPTPTPPLGVGPQDVGAPTATVTPLIINVTPTPSPTPQLLPAEQLGPITVDGTSHRTGADVTVHVRVGKSVSTVTCSYVLQDTGQTTVLGTADSTTPIDADVSENIYTFTPQAAGTYAVNCTGIALTVSGQRAVSATGTPFAVEAKG